MKKYFSMLKLTLAGSVLATGLILWVGLSLQGCGDGNGFFKNLSLCDVSQEVALNSQTRIGGSSNVVTMDSTNTWTFYNVANDLRATQVGVTKGAKYSLPVAGFILDVDVIEYPASSGAYYALVSMGDKGITVINVTDPTNMTEVLSVAVNYYQDGINFAEGGGAIITDEEIGGVHAPIASLAVYNDAAGVDQLIIANTDYGLHKTKLANLFDTTAREVEDGTLLIDSDGDLETPDEVYTLQFAGENPWGGPKSLTLYKNPNIVDDKGTLFVAMGFMGIGIFDPETLEQVGRYNLYTDPDSTEDWFVNPDGSNLDVATQVFGAGTADPYLDDFTGMPDYRQASYEITEIWHNQQPCPETIPFVDVVGCAPWAAFDRYGKHYYDARKVEVATFSDGEGETTIAYIAYALGGMVAVDVSGYKDAGPYDPDAGTPFADFLTAQYMGYAPAVPANGPDAPTGASSKSLFPHFGSGMLKEAGIIDVKVDVDNKRVFFSDHFAGLMAIGNADDPSTWHGSGPLPYDNDIVPGSSETIVLGDHWPDYEFITSYDMTPYDETDNESLPVWLYESPTLLVTGEVNGHGNSFMLMPAMDATVAGQVDIVAASGGGGINFIDLTDINNSGTAATDDGFEALVHMSTTDALFREADGSMSTEGMSIGHSAGVASYHNLLFLADGPHGMAVWQIADAERCFPFDEIKLLANTLQDEYTVTIDGVDINPTPHAYDVILDDDKQNAIVMSQSRGLRRVGLGSLDGVDAASIPLLLKPSSGDIYEHNTTTGSLGGLRMQDHAYDVALDGNLAFVADGSNGLTVFDLDKDPSVDTDFVVGNIGGETRTQPSLGHATGVALWNDTSDANNVKKYAFVAAGHAGVGVVDVTNVANETGMTLVKVFEPIKIEEGKFGKADGRSVNVMVIDDNVYFTYDSFGMVVYSIADLIKPLPEGMDPTDIWEPNTVGERPEVLARFRLKDPLLGGSEELADLGGGALGMFYQAAGDKRYFYVAYGAAGVIKIDWTDVTAPVLVDHIDTAGEAADVEVISGRAYVADGAGGLVIIK